MRKTNFFLYVALAALVACTSSDPVQRQPAATPIAAPPPLAPPSPPPPDRSCKEMQLDAHNIVSAHNGCTADSDCATTAGACPTSFGCGKPVNADQLDEVNAELGAISDRFKKQCGRCASDGLRCEPNAVCREGHCEHEPLTSTCDRLETDAEALIQKHNSCAVDGDCVFAHDAGACPSAFACGVTVNRTEEQAFVAVAAPLSKTFSEYCERCMVEVTHCSASTPTCEAGRCSRRRATRVEAPSPKQQCAGLEDVARDLLLRHNRCTTSEDCVQAREGAHCLETFACGVAVHRAEERDFYEHAATLSNLYRDQCNECSGEGALCAVREPVCTEGRCVLKVPHRHPLRSQ